MQGPAKIEWLNLNKYRSYPFIEDSDLSLTNVLALPNSAVIDFDGVQYGYTRNDVVLTNVTVGGADVAFTFVFPSVLPVDYLTFVVPFAAAFPYRSYATASSGAINATVTFGSGVADMASFTPGSYDLVTPAIVEPALRVYLARDRVNQVLATAVGSTAVAGDIYFQEGHNCRVTIFPTSDTVRIAAVLGAGEGVDCSLPGTGELVRCPEALLRINGLHGGSNGEFYIGGGDGVTIQPDAAANTIVIKSNANIEDAVECGGD